VWMVMAIQSRMFQMWWLHTPSNRAAVK
jgi:hypothetical protein